MLALFRRFGFAAVVAGAIGLIVLVVVGKTALDAVGDGSGAGPGRPGGGPGAALVVAAPVGLQSFSDALQALGTAQARESIVLTPKVADTIRRLRFDSGARVRAGQVLVEMSNVEQAADLEEARAANEAAQQELARYQELFDRGFASQARLDAVRAAADAARARFEAGGSRIADRTIRAPFAGIIGLRTASPGQFVRPGDQIGTLDDITEIRLDFDVPETQIAALELGVAIEARAAALPQRTFAGTIQHIDSRVDAATRTVRVRAMLPNDDEALRPGMLMTVVINANPREGLGVPEAAVLEEAQTSFVYRVAAGAEGQIAERVVIATGRRSGGMVEALSGLSVGDLVVTEGVQAVRPGQPVRLEPPTAAGAANGAPARSGRSQ